MGFAKKFFFLTLFISLLMESQTTSKDPWGQLGWYFHADLKSWLPETGLALNPLEISIIVILLAWALRGRRDRRYRFERGLLFAPIVAFAGILAYGLLWGFVQSDSNFTTALFEVRALAYCVAAYFLVGILFTHRRDLETLTWTILIASFLLGIDCIVRYFVYIPGHYVGDLDYDHEDATILAFALLLAAAMILLGSSRRQKWFALASMPVEILALMVTHRRAGEAALAIAMVFLALILFRVNKSLFLKIVPVTALVFSVYLGAYWNCENGTLCQPARAISSQFGNPDPRDAQSNEYRILEKEDISLNIQSNPLTGVGFGRPFLFFIDLPNLSFWPFWHYTPHNEILWIWMDLGMFGFMAFWWLIGSGLYRGGRLIQALSAAGDNKSLALLAAGTGLIMMQVSVSYVDLGLTSDRAMLLLGVTFGVIGHLSGILRRSLDKEQPAHFSRWGAGLAEEPEEVQVGVLARVLVTPTELTPTGRSLTTNRPRTHPRWEQNGSASRQAPPRGSRAASLRAAQQQSNWADHLDT